MIGATPTSGSAEKKLPSGSSPRPRKAKRLRDDGDQQAGAAADDVADQHAANEGLDEILPRASAATRQTAPPPRSAPAAAPAARRSRAPDFPEIEHHRAEQQRNGEIRAARRADALRGSHGRKLHHAQRRSRARPPRPSPRSPPQPSRRWRDRAAAPASSRRRTRRPRGRGRRPPIRPPGAGCEQQRRASVNASTDRPRRQGHRGGLTRERQHQRQQHARRGQDKSQSEPARIQGRAPIARGRDRSARPTSPIRPEASTAAASSAAQIWMVWP